MGARALAAALLLAFTGCSEGAKHVGDLRVTGEIRPTFDPLPTPPGEPATAISDVAFATRSLGVGTAHGRIQLGLGQLQLTRDGGKTWRTLLRGLDVQFSNVSVVGRRHFVVLGLKGPPTPKLPWKAGVFTYRSDDAGKTWHRFATTLNGDWPPTLRFVTPTLGFAFELPGGVDHSNWLLRTTDGGHSWQRVPTPPDAGGTVSSVDFVSRRTGYAASPRRCGAGLYRTDDGGATWHGVPGSCFPGVHAYSVDFVDARHGFLAGGSSGRGLLFATSDGGRTWTKRSSEPRESGFWIRVAFDPSGRTGWGQRGECYAIRPPCSNVGGLWRTSDGGSTWQRERLHYVLNFDAIDRKHVWAVGDRGSLFGVLWKTTNAGRSWIPLAGPRGMAPDWVTFAGPRVLVATSGGYLLSSDSGRTWRWFHMHVPRGSEPVVVRPDLAIFARPPGASMWLSTNLGRTWRRIRRPSPDPWKTAFSDTRTGVAAGNGRVGFTTSDGGRTWVRRRFPFNSRREVQLDAAPGLITESAFGSRSVALTEDGGRSWRFLAFPRGYEDAYAEPGPGGTLRLSADRVNHGYEHYVSFDRGRTWKRIRGLLRAVAPIAPEGEETWAVEKRRDGILWHSTDGGRHWTEVRPRPPTTR